MNKKIIKILAELASYSHHIAGMLIGIGTIFVILGVTVGWEMGIKYLLGLGVVMIFLFILGCFIKIIFEICNKINKWGTNYLTQEANKEVEKSIEEEMAKAHANGEFPSLQNNIDSAEIGDMGAEKLGQTNNPPNTIPLSPELINSSEEFSEAMNIMGLFEENNRERAERAGGRERIEGVASAIVREERERDEMRAAMQEALEAPMRPSSFDETLEEQVMGLSHSITNEELEARIDANIEAEKAEKKEKSENINEKISTKNAFEQLNLE